MTQRSWAPDDTSVLTALRPVVPAPRRSDDWLEVAALDDVTLPDVEAVVVGGSGVEELERSWAPDPWDPDTSRLIPEPARRKQPRKHARASVEPARFGKRLVNAGLTVVVVVVVLAFLGLAIGPRSGAYQTTTMLTGSMRPHYPPGSVLVITPMPTSELAPGQVITFHAPTEDRRIVTHRVVSVDRSKEFPAITTKGDANAGIDPWVAAVKTDEVWRVRFVVPGVGRAIQELRRPQVQFALTRALPALLLMSLLVAVWRPERTRD